MAEITEVQAPRENVNDETVTVLRWLVADGDRVDEGAVVVEVETSKTNVDVTAPVSGYVRHAVKEGDDIAVGDVLCWITAQPDTPLPEVSSACPAGPDQAAAANEAVHTPIQFNGGPISSSGTTRFSREALAVLEQRGLDAGQFAGRGLVRARDILEAAGAATRQETHTSPSAPATSDTPVSAAGVSVRKEALSRQKRTEARYLAAGHRNALPSGVTLSCPTRGLRALAADQEVLRGNATPLIVHETARLLAKFPRLNGYYHDGAAYLYEEVNIGFAVDGEYGLKVPVIRNADKKTLATIAEEMENLILNYADDALAVEDLAGGTFTITDLSGEDVAVFYPLINQGQAGILGIGAEQFVPGILAGSYTLTLAFDHQITAGREAAQFMRELRDRLAAYEETFFQESRRGADEPYCSVCMQPLSALHPRVYLLQRLRADGGSEAICSTCAQGY